MRIDLILFLVSSAHLPAKTCLAAAAGFEPPTTAHKATFKSVDDNARSTSSEGSLRVRAPMHDEDEERLILEAVKKAASRVSQSWTTSRDQKKVLKILRLFRNEGATNSGIEVLRPKMERLVQKGMTQDRFITALKLEPEDALFASKLVLLDEFIKAFNRWKPEPQHVTIALALESSRIIEKGMTPELFATALKLDAEEALFADKLLFFDEFITAFNRVTPEPQHETVAYAFKPFLEKGMTPGSFVTALKLDPNDAQFANKLLLIDEFVKAFNLGKPDSQPVTVAHTLTQLVANEMMPGGFVAALKLDPKDARYANKVLLIDDFVKAFKLAKPASRHVTVARALTPVVESGMTPASFVPALKLDPEDALLEKKLLVLDEFLKAFNLGKPKDRHVTLAQELEFSPIVENGMMPDRFVTALKLDPNDAQFANKLLIFDEFVKAFNRGNPDSPHVTVAYAFSPFLENGMTPGSFVPALKLDPEDAQFANKLLLIDEFVKAFNLGKPDSQHTTIALALNPLVRKGMTPGRFVTALNLDPEDALLANKLLFLDEFVKAFNSWNPKSEHVTVARALESTPVWEARAQVLKSFLRKEVWYDYHVDTKAFNVMLKNSFTSLDELVTALQVQDNHLMSLRVLAMLERFVSLRGEAKSNAVFDFLHRKLGPNEFARQIQQALTDSPRKEIAKTFNVLLRAKNSAANGVQ